MSQLFYKKKWYWQKCITLTSFIKQPRERCNRWRRYLNLVCCYIVLKDKENVEKYLEFIREKTKNVSKENVDEFENTLKELDLIVKV